MRLNLPLAGNKNQQVKRQLSTLSWRLRKLHWTSGEKSHTKKQTNFFAQFNSIFLFDDLSQIKEVFLKNRSVVFHVFTALLGGAAANLGGSLGAVPGGQPTAPSLNPPSQIDPSSIERAYAALGLTYQGNQIQTQTPQPNMSNQALQGQAGMRPMNPMSKTWFLFRLNCPGMMLMSWGAVLTEHVFPMQRCQCYGCQWRCSCSEPTSQPAAGHHDAPQREQPGVRRNLHTIAPSHAPNERTSSLLKCFRRWMFFCIQIPRPFCEEVNCWIDVLPSPSAWWAMPVGLDLCPQPDLPQPRAWGKAGMKISRRTYGTTWCINCRCQEHWHVHIVFSFMFCANKRNGTCAVFFFFTSRWYFMLSLKKSCSVWCVMDLTVTLNVIDNVADDG